MSERRGRPFTLLVALLWAGVVCLTHGGTVVLRPVADTMLIEAAPFNNAGGLSFANVGTTQNFTRNRALVRFDVSSTIPPGSRVVSASLSVEVVGRPKDGFSPTTLALHKLLKPWGEGSKTSADTRFPGLGSPATEGEATWTHTFYGTTNVWSEPGGASGVDFDGVSSGEITVYGVEDSPYVFLSNANNVRDVQNWIDHSESNYGWILICATENVDFTARRLGTREDPGRSSVLTIEFEPPPRLAQARTSGGFFLFEFVAFPGRTYSVEATGSISANPPWSVLTNLPPVTVAMNLTISDRISSAARFYRVVAK